VISSIAVITSWPYEVVRHSETLIRRRRWLISAQGWSGSDNLGFKNKEEVLPERVRQLANPFRVTSFFIIDPKVLASSNLGLKLANAFGVMWSVPRIEARVGPQF
jgi:hypothetical protein